MITPALEPIQIPRLAGSAASRDVEKARGYLAADWAVRRFAPTWLRRIGLDEDAARLEGLPPVVDEATARPLGSGHVAVSGVVRRSFEDVIAAGVAKGMTIRMASPDEAAKLRAVPAEAEEDR